MTTIPSGFSSNSSNPPISSYQDQSIVEPQEGDKSRRKHIMTQLNNLESTYKLYLSSGKIIRDVDSYSKEIFKKLAEAKQSLQDFIDNDRPGRYRIALTTENFAVTKISKLIQSARDGIPFEKTLPPPPSPFNPPQGQGSKYVNKSKFMDK